MKKCLFAILILCLATIGCIPPKNRWTKIVDTKSDTVVGIGVKYSDPNTLEPREFILGTGFIVEKNVVATAAHVIKVFFEAKILLESAVMKPYIQMMDGKKIPMDTAYFDEDKDVGIIITRGMETNQKFNISYRMPDKAEEVITIGHPMGVMYMVSRGSVMNKTQRGTNPKDMMDVIYVGSRIAGGASGSPMMDAYGNVIGVVIEIRYDQYGWYNYNVSPIKYLKKLLVSYHKDRYNKKAMKIRREIYNLSGVGDDNR